MRTVTLTRRPADNDDQGTIGDWVSDSGFSCVSIELPWRDNETDLSCVPPATHPLRWFDFSGANGMRLSDHGRGRAHVRRDSSRQLRRVTTTEGAGIAQLATVAALGEDIAVFPGGHASGRYARPKSGVTNSCVEDPGDAGRPGHRRLLADDPVIRLPGQRQVGFRPIPASLPRSGGASPGDTHAGVP